MKCIRSSDENRLSLKFFSSDTCGCGIEVNDTWVRAVEMPIIHRHHKPKTEGARLDDQRDRNHPNEAVNMQYGKFCVFFTDSR